MDNKWRDIAEYIIIAVNEFAKRHQLTEVQAYRYLKRFMGIAFLEKQYNVIHTLTFEDVVESLTIYCQRQGGALYDTISRN